MKACVVQYWRRLVSFRMHKKIILASIDRAPSLQDLELLLQSAKESPSSTIGLPFHPEKDQEFTLSASFAFASESTPKWYLFDSEKNGSTLLWTTSTQHLDLVRAKVQDLTRTAMSNSKTVARIPGMPAKPLELPAPTAFNTVAYGQCLMGVTNQEIGLFNEGCFFWFLSLEFDRFQRFKTPFSLLIISLNKSDVRGPLPEFGQKLKASIRSVDLPCLFQNSLALILPQSEMAESRLCALRLAKVMDELLGTGRFSIGLANVPDTCEHPGVLVSAALEAADFARLNDKAVMTFGENS